MKNQKPTTVKQLHNSINVRFPPRVLNQGHTHSKRDPSPMSLIHKISVSANYNVTEYICRENDSTLKH